MRKNRSLRELIVATALFTMNALAVGYFLGVPQSFAGPAIQYEDQTPDGCSDGIDNEVPPDGLIDCGDPDCVGVDPCVAPAPALGPTGLIAGTGMLLLVGYAALRMRRREDQ